MASISGARFAQVRTPESFRAWAAEDPQAAASWLGKVARTVGAGDQFSLEPSKLGEAFDQLAARAIATVQTERAASIGWSTQEPVSDAPAITGTLRLENGEPVLDTPAGKLSMVSANFFELEGNDWQKNHFLGGHDVVAFAGQVVTVKGWPDASWAPGAPAKLVVEEFAPGSSSDFVTGRVLVQGDDVLVRVRPGKDVKVLDPVLKAQLAAYPQLGVILPGAVEKNGDAYSFSGHPDDYYVLLGFGSAGAPAADGRQPVAFYGAHGKSIPGTIDKAAYDAGAERSSRHYVLGRFVNGQLEAKGYTPHAGAWSFAGEKPAPSARFAEWVTPLEEPPPASFALPPPPAVPTQASMIALTQEQRWAGYQVGAVKMLSGFGQVYPEQAARLGLPLEGERADGRGGSVQRFERGVMTWSPANGLVVHDRPVQAELVKLNQDQRWAGYELGGFKVQRGFGMEFPEYADRLGLPLEEEHGDGGDGAVQKFEKGSMTWNPRDGVRALPEP